MRELALSLSLLPLGPLLVVPFALDLPPRNLLEALVGALERVGVELLQRNQLANQLLSEHEIIVHGLRNDFGDLVRLELDERKAF